MKTTKLLKFVAVAAVAVLTMASTTGCSKRIGPGFAGIRVNLVGGQRGIADYPIVTGRVFYNPWTEEVHEFPTFVQTATWTRDLNEGAKGVDESITVNSIEGAVVNLDIQVNYRMDFDHVPHIFAKYRKDADEITGTIIRGRVRDEFSGTASKMKVVDIFGSQKRFLEDAVRDSLNKKLGPDGFIFEGVSIIGEMRVDQNVANAIHNVIVATQKAQEAENKVRQIQAEAEQAVAKARGDSLSAVIAARGQAQANRDLAASISPTLVNYIVAQKWNGQTPYAQGGNGMLLQLPMPAREQK